MPQSQTIGFIGLGAMGLGMATNLLEKTGQLNTVCNRSREPVDALVAQGAHECANLTELADQSDNLELGSDHAERLIIMDLC
jgi:3-hydroxyisobutyrate dehydrogenase-like beta-hydroxyacid dehydrogenase